MNEQPTASVQLPRWVCHKEVWGDRIREILPATPDDQRTTEGDTGMRWYLECGAVIVVTSSLIARGAPVVGDYFVQYDDGYQSWSPVKAFEDGYVRLSMGTV